MKTWLKNDLEEDEIKLAMKMINDKYPVKNTAIERLFPTLTYCRRCRKLKNIKENSVSTLTNLGTEETEKQLQKEADEELELPEFYLRQTELEESRLRDIIAKYGEEYKGTCPVSCAKRAHVQQCMRLGLASLLIKKEGTKK
jgi:hypothetical protein